MNIYLICFKIYISYIIYLYEQIRQSLLTENANFQKEIILTENKIKLQKEELDQKKQISDLLDMLNDNHLNLNNSFSLNIHKQNYFIELTDQTEKILMNYIEEKKDEKNNVNQSLLNLLIKNKQKKRRRYKNNVNRKRKN